MTNTVYQTDLPGLKLLQRGKVRDIYDLGQALLIVATDRLSAFDVVLPDPIPQKGHVLNQISLFWFGQMAANLTPSLANHVITGDVAGYPEACQPYADMLDGRSMLVKKTKPLPIECVVRGYISGSGWKSYQKTQSICGISLPAGLKESDRLPEPIFTPSTKEEIGQHDINIDFAEAEKRIGPELAHKVRDMSLAIYRKGAEMALEKGIIIADTKFEFGLIDDELILIDEILTPDSSRFWPKDTYAPGGPQLSFDKQYVRDYLLSLNWDQQPPAPKLPDEVVANTSKKYLEAFQRLTGNEDTL